MLALGYACKLALSVTSLWHLVAKMAPSAPASAGQSTGQMTPGWVGTWMAHRAAQGLGVGKILAGLDPRDVSLGLCLLADFVC